MELSAEQMGLQRSQQLRELYENLSAGDNNQQEKRPSAALSPEDLTDAEWFYLVCMSFVFAPGQGWTSSSSFPSFLVAQLSQTLLSHGWCQALACCLWTAMVLNSHCASLAMRLKLGFLVGGRGSSQVFISQRPLYASCPCMNCIHVMSLHIMHMLVTCFYADCPEELSQQVITSGFVTPIMQTAKISAALC